MIGRGAAAVLAGGFIILTSLLLTGSRGGIAATGLALVAFAVPAWRSRAEREPALWPMLTLGLVFVGGTGLMFGTAVTDKVAGAGFFDPNRLAIYRLTLQSIFDRPWLGWGYGTFVDVFPMYRDGSITGSGTWSQAHDSYLEAVQGLGIVFGSMFIGLVALVAFRCLRGAASRRENAVVPLVAVGAAILVGAHALVDFSLQIQAIALTVAALLGAGIAQAESSRVPLGDGPAGPITVAVSGPVWPEPVPAFDALGLAASVNRPHGDDVVRLRRGPGLGSRALRGTGAGGRRDAARLGIRRNSRQRWIRRTAGSAFRGSGVRPLDLPLAQIAAIDPETGQQQVAELTALVAARPLSSQVWLSLAVFRLVAHEELARVLAALRLSWLTGPNEGSVLWQRGVFGLALWDFLPASERERTARDLARAMLERLVTDRQTTAIKSIFGTKSMEMRAQIRALLEKRGLETVDLARMGLLAQ